MNVKRGGELMWLDMLMVDINAVSFHKDLEAMRVDPKVIVATSINPKMGGGRLFLNATSGMHVYFDKKTTAGEDRFYKVVARDTGLPSAAPLLKSYAKVETMTISELNYFVVSAASQGGNDGDDDNGGPPCNASEDDKTGPNGTGHKKMDVSSSK